VRDGRERERVRERKRKSEREIKERQTGALKRVFPPTLLKAVQFEKCE